MKKLVLGMLAVVALATSAQAAVLWYENFEQSALPPEWTIWTERGTNTSTIAAENPQLGDPLNTPLDMPNQTLAEVGGGTDNFNGGIWTVVSGLPTGVNLKIDGYWRTSVWGGGDDWTEVIVIEGNAGPSNGSDYNADQEYKYDAGGTSGLFSATANNINDGTFQTASGTVVVLLKVGNWPGTTQVQFDDVYITPEPASLGLFGLAAIPFFFRRRSA